MTQDRKDLAEATLFIASVFAVAILCLSGVG
jgi:hypothetical protein